MAQPASTVPSPLSATASGAADDSTSRDEAADSFWQGKRYYDQADFERARERFEHTYRLTLDAELLYNIGQTYRQQGLCESALISYRSFLDAAPESPHAGLAKRHVESLLATCLAPPPTKSNAPGSMPMPSTAPVPSIVPSAGNSPAKAQRLTSKPVERSTALDPSTGKSTSEVDTDRHHKAKLSVTQWVTLSTLVVGTIGAGTAVGVGIWNESRFRTWSERDRDLAKGLAADRSAAAWVQQQGANDRLIEDVRQIDNLTRYLGLGAGISLLASAVLYFAFPESTPRVGTARFSQHTVNCTASPQTNQTVFFSYRAVF